MSAKIEVPATGRFLIEDGKIFRVKDWWVEQRATNRIKMGVVIWKDEIE